MADGSEGGKSMKKGYYVIAALVVMSFAVTAVMISMMPDIVPIHYNAMGELDGMGSRYTYVIFPCFALIMGLFMGLLARRRRDTSEETVLLTVGAFTTAVFTVLGTVFGMAAIGFDAENTAMPDVNRIMLILMGILLMVMCNFMPKVTMNSAFGLRTPWSMKDDETWRRSQRFGGISGMICGFVMIVSALFAGGMAAMVIMLALIFVWAILCVYMSYRYARG